MQEQLKSIELLFERTIEYCNTGLQLVKLKSYDKASEMLSYLFTHLLGLVIIFFFALFLNLGLAIWFGEIFGKVLFGFLAVAGLNLFFWAIYRILLFKFMKKRIRNFLIDYLQK